MSRCPKTPSSASQALRDVSHLQSTYLLCNKRQELMIHSTAGETCVLSTQGKNNFSFYKITDGAIRTCIFLHRDRPSPEARQSLSRAERRHLSPNSFPLEQQCSCRSCYES